MYIPPTPSPYTWLIGAVFSFRHLGQQGKRWQETAGENFPSAHSLMKALLQSPLRAWAIGGLR